jgi:hypothetical protein
VSRVGRTDFGRVAVMRVKSNQANIDVTGAANKFLFDTVACQHNGLEPLVLGFFAILPTSTVVVATGKVLDGLSLAQLIKRVSIRMSPNAPPTAFGKGRAAIIDDMDGPRCLQALHHLSGVPVFPTTGGDLRFMQDGTLVAAGSGSAVNTARSPSADQRRTGPLQMQGPYATGLAAGAQSFVDRVTVFFPIGIRRGEEMGRNGVPMRYFAGKPMGDACQGSSAGEIEIALNTLVDNVAVGWGAESMSILALVMLAPRGHMPVGQILHMSNKRAAENEFKPDLGLRGLLAFHKPLTAAGAQAAHDYTRVRVRLDGVEQEPEQEIATRALADAVLAKPGEQWVTSTTALTHAMATRKVGHGRLIMRNDASILKGDGATEGDLSVIIDETGETAPYEYTDATFCPSTPEVRAATKAYMGVLDVDVAPRNGNKDNVHEDLKAGLPGTTLGTAPKLASG